MKYKEYSHRYAEAIIATDKELNIRYREFTSVLHNISDEDIIEKFEIKHSDHVKKGTSYKSVTPSINSLIKERMALIPGWDAEVDIFNDTKGEIGNTEWRLDFACENGLAIEVAFNHGEAIAWNLIKPCLASELNHVQKAYQTRLGIYVCATDALKKMEILIVQVVHTKKLFDT
ncbi:hypothetical protein ACTQ6A_15560 [Lachnospiraceae bacterium LCP25S3_G4]